MYVRHYPFTASQIKTGAISGETSATKLPDIKCTMVNFKAQSGNAGSVYIGVAGVTKPTDSTTDATTGLELDAGQETGWLPVGNLNVFYIICDNAGDDLTYMALGPVEI